MTTLAQEATLLFESCTGTWIFDTARMRFRRILKGLGRTASGSPTAWRRYYGLEVSASESFAVVLNPQRTRRLRSWRHLSRCPECADGSEGARRMETLRGAIAS
ncbi:MAG TPA: hypothetical protein VND62_06085 [Acidimicrobiales bacterium]|nr:hypothetical protein [Acidimicrobiales bacterium]